MGPGGRRGSTCRAGMDVNRGYPEGQLAKALVTAASHEDEETRARADQRIAQWWQVLDGMAGGALRIGSRTPVAGLPVWVTPEVMRGGFATGTPAAGGPLQPYELAAAQRAGIAPDRRALFMYYVSDAGMVELGELLDSGRYDVALPEEAALLTVAWLARAGDREAALGVLEEIAPYAARLRFLPRPTAVPPSGPDAVFRESVGDVSEVLARRRPSEAVETMREALSVWNPFADELLELWLETVEDGRVGAQFPAGWSARARQLHERSLFLAARHNRCSKYRNPKENLGILIRALRNVASNQPIARPGLLQHAVDSMVAKRGRPGSATLTRLRAVQAEQAALPSHHTMAQLLLRRLSGLPQDSGLSDPEAHTGPVSAAEEVATGVASGTPLPDPLREVVKRALSAPVETLVEEGIVPSAEVLATLTPKIVASATAAQFEDPALQRLIAATYEAFRNRRSLLLLNYAKQVQFTELPWRRAVASRRRTDVAAPARTALVRLGELALQAFPATVLPNPLIRELDTLARSAGLEVPFTEELAADIFMGGFSPKFARAATLAAALLKNSLYARYYWIDYRAVRSCADFGALCSERAGSRGYSVAANGMVIEQAQILTTHNLAALVTVGVAPLSGWLDLAQRSLDRAVELMDRLETTPRRLATVKDAAYAWRQMVFYLSLCERDDQQVFAAAARSAHPRLAGAAADLFVAVRGRVPERAFTGWSDQPHPILARA